MSSAAVDATVVAVELFGRDGAAGARVEIPCVMDGPWSGFLGGFPTPAAGALDALAGAVARVPGGVERVEVTGHGGPALMVVVWLRTIWLGPGARVVLRWHRAGEPAAGTAEQLAAGLCAALVDEVRTSDPEGLLRGWGIEAGERWPDPEGSMDLMLGLVDHWDIGARRRAMPMEWSTRFREALAHCAAREWSPIGIYGAGTHTRAMGSLLMEPPVEVACIIDDDARRHGHRLWGYPIVGRAAAVSMGVRAVVLSANSMEDVLWERSAELRAAGVAVVRLYGEGGA